MKQAKDLLPANPGQPVLETSYARNTKKLLPKKMVLQIFEKLRIRYRDQWSARLGDDPDDIQKQVVDWQEALGNCTSEQIAWAYESWDSEFPPSSLQFRTRCKAMERKPMHQIQPKLERPPRDKDAASQAVADMRASLLDHGADLEPADRPQAPDVSRDWYAAHGYTNLDGDYDDWLMSKPHNDDKPQHRRRQ